MLQATIHTPGIKLETNDLNKLHNFVNEKIQPLVKLSTEIIKVDVWFTATPTSTKLYTVKIELKEFLFKRNVINIWKLVLEAHSLLLAERSNMSF